jgi:hypothetical protein
VIKKPQKKRPRPDFGCSAIGRKEGRKESIKYRIQCKSDGADIEIMK